MILSELEYIKKINKTNLNKFLWIYLDVLHKKEVFITMNKILALYVTYTLDIIRTKETLYRVCQGHT